MTLPPERITVKRRRDEDPIEALVIPSKKYRPSALWKLAGNENDEAEYAQPVTSPAFEAIQPLALDPPKAPIVRTPLPGEDVPTEPPDTSSSSKVALPSGESPAPSAISRLVRRKEKSHQSTSEPRRFHLTKSSLKISSPYLVSKTPAQRHARDRKKELAVFVEARDVSREQSIRRKQVPSEEAIAPPSDSTQGKLDAYQTPRKRPNATAVERKWRAENWNKHTGFKASTEQRTKSVRHFSHPSQEWDYESPEFAAQLQQIALQETEAQKESSKNHSSRQCLKVKPKPPKPRQPWVERKIHKEDEDDVMAESLSLDGDTDYVFDTYIRTIAQPPGTMEESDTFSDPLQGLGNTNTGILVIEDGEEQELWQTFGEYIDSDPEWNSEEEDENAEDFYGNDYPEDEVNSDDEYGRGAYNYRHNASDDEEFDDEEPQWSDDEKETS